jgi:hypothetical protein
MPGTCCYLDDVCVAGRTKGEAKQRLLSVLQKLNDHNIRINLNKCKFMQQQVEYVGHVIGAGGITPTKSKYLAILNSEPPNDHAELLKFLGLLNYYHAHIPHLS